MSDERCTLRRRRFLEIVGAAGVVAALPACGGGASSQNTTPFDAGAVTDYTAPVWKLFQANTTIVGRDASGFFAFSAVCPHEGCLVTLTGSTGASGGADEVSADGHSNCPCHGSTFLPDGSVVQGPARTALPHFAVTVANGRLTVTPATVVAATARTTA